MNDSSMIMLSRSNFCTPDFEIALANYCYVYVFNGLFDRLSYND